MPYDPNIAPRNLEEWNKLINHYLAIETEKARADETYQPETREQIEAKFACFYPHEPQSAEPEKTLAELKQQKLAELGAAFHTACKGATVDFQGYTIDADETANRNIEGLITAMEANGVNETQFCDAGNQFHTVTLADLKAMRVAVITKGQLLYQLKWQKREAIENAQTVDELNAIDVNMHVYVAGE